MIMNTSAKIRSGQTQRQCYEKIVNRALYEAIAIEIALTSVSVAELTARE